MQSIPFIHGIYRAAKAYEVGRGLLLIGYRFDMPGTNVKHARRFVKHLRKTLRAFRRNHPNEHWSGEQTYDLFTSYPFLDGQSIAQRYPDFVSEDKPKYMGRLSGPSEKQPDISYSHTDLAILVEEIISETRSFHMTPDCYKAIGETSWQGFDHIKIPANAAKGVFALQLDGGSWQSSTVHPSEQVRINYLFAAFDDDGAVIAEHTTRKVCGHDNTRARVIGCKFTRSTNSLEWLTSENILFKGERIMQYPPSAELERLFRTAVNFIALLHFPETRLVPLKELAILGDHYKLIPPTGVSIKDAIHVMIRSALHV